jgi:4-aminobutyrate aminotransferase-like enzyme
MEALELNRRAGEIGRTVRSRLEALRSSVPAITDVRGRGAMMALEVHEGGDPARPGAGLVKSVIDACRQRGLVLLPAGVASDVIRVLCPLVIPEAQLARGLDILSEELKRHAGAHAPTPAMAAARRD